jgi:hypothetical protein
MTKKDKYYGLFLLFLVINSLLPSQIYVHNNNQLPKYLLSEDGVYESIATIFCFLASAVFFYSFFKFPEKTNRFMFSLNRNIVVLLFSILLFFLFFEEISWGQRIIGIKTPGIITKINSQNEIYTIKIFYYLKY